jgi:thymidylate kinase
VLITFSGLDGAGKSTLIAWLRAALEAKGYSVAALHMNDEVGVYACLRTVRNRLIRLVGRRVPPAHTPPGDTAPVPPAGALRLRHALRRIRNALVWSPTVRCCLYPVDLLIVAVYRLYHERLKNRVLVMDRYFYDTLVDLSKDGPRRVHRLLAMLTPTPEVPVLLDVSPARAFERKREYSLDYLERRWIAYQAVFSRVPTRVLLPNAEPQVARATLWQAVTGHAGLGVVPTPERLDRPSEAQL